MFGAAAGAAKLLKLDEAQIVWALGNAATQSAGLCECLGWPAKSVSVGNAARNGLFSALLAEKGFEGPPEPIAGAQGFLATMGEPPNWAAADRRASARAGKLDWTIRSSPIRQGS